MRMILIWRRLEIVLWDGRVYYPSCVNLIKRPLCRHTNPRRGAKRFDAQVLVFCWTPSFDSQFKWRTDSVFSARDRLDQVKVRRGHSQGRDPTDARLTVRSFWKSRSVCLFIIKQHVLSCSEYRPGSSGSCGLMCGLCWCVQVTVSMYKRGAQGWLGKPLIATATIPSSTRVIFRIRGEAPEAKIPAGSIRSITLSIWTLTLYSLNPSFHVFESSEYHHHWCLYHTNEQQLKYFTCALDLFNDGKWFSAAVIFDNCWESFYFSNQTSACIFNTLSPKSPASMSSYSWHSSKYSWSFLKCY